MWAAPLSDNARAVVLFNRHRTLFPKTIRVTWAQLGLTSPGPSSSSGPGGPGGPGVRALVRDLYAGRDLGVFEGGFEARVASHDVMAIRVTPVEEQEVSRDGLVGGEKEGLPICWPTALWLGCQQPSSCGKHP